MFAFLKKLFGSKPEAAPAPYKVEAKVEAPVVEKPKAEKKPAAKAKTTAKKPRAPKAPKA